MSAVANTMKRSHRPSMGMKSHRKVKHHHHKRSMKHRIGLSSFLPFDYDLDKDHTFQNEAGTAIDQFARQSSVEDQEIDQLVIVRDSENIILDLTDTKIAVSLQIALQLAIALVISLSIGSPEEAERITQDLIMNSVITQRTIRSIRIENSFGVRVNIVDTEAAANIQALLQLLLALVARLDVA